LAAASINFVFKVAAGIKNVDNEIAKIKGILNFTDEFIFTVFDQSNNNLRTIETVAGTCARSVNLNERFVIELFEFIINSVNGDLERSAFSTQALS